MQDLPQPLRPILRTARQKHIPRGQIIIYEGDIPTEVFIIKSGAVKLYDIDDQGNEKILHIVKSPALIPFAFFSGLLRPTRWFYVALTDCDLFVVSAQKLQEAIDADSELAKVLMRAFSDDTHELLVRLSSLGKTNTHGKLVAALKFLLVCHSTPRRSAWSRVNFAVNHQLLADLAGITRESAATVMKEFTDQKIVRNPRLTILEINRDKLMTA